MGNGESLPEGEDGVGDGHTREGGNSNVPLKGKQRKTLLKAGAVPKALPAKRPGEDPKPRKRLKKLSSGTPDGISSAHTASDDQISSTTKVADSDTAPVLERIRAENGSEKVSIATRPQDDVLEKSKDTERTVGLQRQRTKSNVEVKVKKKLKKKKEETEPSSEGTISKPNATKSKAAGTFNDTSGGLKNAKRKKEEVNTSVSEETSPVPNSDTTVSTHKDEQPNSKTTKLIKSLVHASPTSRTSGPEVQTAAAKSDDDHTANMPTVATSATAVHPDDVGAKTPKRKPSAKKKGKDDAAIDTSNLSIEDHAEVDRTSGDSTNDKPANKHAETSQGLKAPANKKSPSDTPKKHKLNASTGSKTPRNPAKSPARKKAKSIEIDQSDTPLSQDNALAEPRDAAVSEQLNAKKVGNNTAIKVVGTPKRNIAEDSLGSVDLNEHTQSTTASRKSPEKKADKGTARDYVSPVEPVPPLVDLSDCGIISDSVGSSSEGAHEDVPAPSSKLARTPKSSLRSSSRIGGSPSTRPKSSTSQMSFTDRESEVGTPALSILSTNKRRRAIRFSELPSTPRNEEYDDDDDDDMMSSSRSFKRRRIVSNSAALIPRSIRVNVLLRGKLDEDAELDQEYRFVLTLSDAGRVSVAALGETIVRTFVALREGQEPSEEETSIADPFTTCNMVWIAPSDSDLGGNSSRMFCDIPGVGLCNLQNEKGFDLPPRALVSSVLKDGEDVLCLWRAPKNHNGETLVSLFKQRPVTKRKVTKTPTRPANGTPGPSRRHRQLSVEDEDESDCEGHEHMDSSKQTPEDDHQSPDLGAPTTQLIVDSQEPSGAVSLDAIDMDEQPDQSRMDESDESDALHIASSPLITPSQAVRISSENPSSRHSSPEWSAVKPMDVDDMLIREMLEINDKDLEDNASLADELSETEEEEGDMSAIASIHKENESVKGGEYRMELENWGSRGATNGNGDGPNNNINVDNDAEMEVHVQNGVGTADNDSPVQADRENDLERVESTQMTTWTELDATSTHVKSTLSQTVATPSRAIRKPKMLFIESQSQQSPPSTPKDSDQNGNRQPIETASNGKLMHDAVAVMSPPREVGTAKAVEKTTIDEKTRSVNGNGPAMQDGAARSNGDQAADDDHTTGNEPESVEETARKSRSPSLLADSVTLPQTEPRNTEFSTQPSQGWGNSQNSSVSNDKEQKATRTTQLSQASKSNKSATQSSAPSVPAPISLFDSFSSLSSQAGSQETGTEPPSFSQRKYHFSLSDIVSGSPVVSSSPFMQGKGRSEPGLLGAIAAVSGTSRFGFSYSQLQNEVASPAPEDDEEEDGDAQDDDDSTTDDNDSDDEEPTTRSTQPASSNMPSKDRMAGRHIAQKRKEKKRRSALYDLAKDESNIAKKTQANRASQPLSQPSSQPGKAFFNDSSIFPVKLPKSASTVASSQQGETSPVMELRSTQGNAITTSALRQEKELAVIFSSLRSNSPDEEREDGW